MEPLLDNPEQPRSFGDPLRVELSVGEIAEFQSLLMRECAIECNAEEAAHYATHLLRLYRQVIDPDVFHARLLERPEAIAVHASLPRPVPVPQPRPVLIRRDVNHAAVLRHGLELLESELRTVDRWPKNWRWVVVALYEVLAHTLAPHCPEFRWPGSGMGQLAALFDVVVEGEPDVGFARESVEVVDQIRTQWFHADVRDWPVTPPLLHKVVADVRSLVRQYAPYDG